MNDSRTISHYHNVTDILRFSPSDSYHALFRLKIKYFHELSIILQWFDMEARVVEVGAIFRYCLEEVL
jgi:hypothetical protein